MPSHTEPPRPPTRLIRDAADQPSRFRQPDRRVQAALNSQGDNAHGSALPRARSRELCPRRFYCCRERGSHHLHWVSARCSSCCRDENSAGQRRARLAAYQQREMERRGHHHESQLGAEGCWWVGTDESGEEGRRARWQPSSRRRPRSRRCWHCGCSVRDLQRSARCGDSEGGARANFYRDGRSHRPRQG